MRDRNNYFIQRDAAKKYFLKFDQEEIIKKWDLSFDRIYLYVTFVNEEYRIHRNTGTVEKGFRESEGLREAGFEEVLSVFDLLCHGNRENGLSGEWAPVNSLKGRPPTAGVPEQNSGKYADLFDREPERFKAACEKLGGRPVDMGDVGYEFPVFADLKVRLKMYHADEEFPAQAILLWDMNTLEYMYYETVFYVKNWLIEKISVLMS